MKINVGIDLGTTYSAVATFSKDTGKVSVLKNSLGSDTTPSVVCLHNSEVKIGEDAKEEQKCGNVDTAAFYKSMMGDLAWSAYIDGKEYSAEALSGIFLKELIADIQRANNVEVDGAVITVPAYFNDKQREATIRAGKAAGLKVLKIINEPTSAIIAYGLASGKDKNVMVYDLGGGTFDVTIAHVSGAKIDVIATNGNHQLGGKDWDAVLINHIVDEFRMENDISIDDHEEDMKELQVRCEEAKKRLTSSPSTMISIQCEGILGKYTVTRESFAEQTSHLLNETLSLIYSCFDEIGKERGVNFGWKDIDEVVLVGGSTRMPQVKDMIIKEYGKPPVTKDINVDTIVAVGAAMQAELCVSNTITLNLGTRPVGDSARGGVSAPFTLTINNNDIHDITAHGLGMLALSSDETSYINSIIIPKNSNVNQVFSRQYTFSGEKLQVYVLQGESRDPHDIDMIGAYSITGMHSGEVNKLTVNFLYNSNGVVEVNAALADGTVLSAARESVCETMDELIVRLEREKKEEEERVRRASRIEIMLMIDTSGSMSGNPLVEAKKAAKGFVDEFDFSRVAISVISFADSSTFKCHNEDNQRKLYRAIDSVTVGEVGYGNDETPVESNWKRFSKDITRIIVVLTDGYWSYQSLEEEAAEIAKKDGVIIYGIGIAGADEAFLNHISSVAGKKVDLSELNETFKQVASSIATEVSSGNTLR